MIQKHNNLVLFLLVLWLAASATVGAQTTRNLSGLRMSSQTMRSMARIYLTYGQYDKAQRMAQQALEKAEQENANPGEMALCLIDLGTVYSQEGMLTEARRMLTRGIDFQVEALSGSHPYVAHSLRLLCEVERRQGSLEDARKTLADAVTIMLDSHTANSREMVPFFLESANLLIAGQDYEKADETYQKALELAEAHFGADHLLTASVLTAYADLHASTGRVDSAQTMIDRALQTQARCYRLDHPRQVDAWLIKARLCRMQGDYRESEAYIAKAVQVTSQSRNVVAMASLYERINRLRTEDQVAAAVL